MKIALVYDRVNKWGGAERVLESLHRLYPQAPLYTSVYDPTGAPWAKGWDIRPSFLQSIPLARRHHELFVLLMPRAFAQFDFSSYDLIISVTSAEAKGITVVPPAKHLCLLLTPTRYLWSHTHLYLGQGIGKVLKLPFISALREIDYEIAQKPNAYIAISQTVAKRCQKYYRRPVAAVIFPPVDTVKFARHPSPCLTHLRDYYLVVSRLVAYKNIDLVIQTFKGLNQEKLVVVGTGSHKPYLISFAGNSKNISFTGEVTDTKLACLYHHAKALIFPQEEDFGIVAVEAQAAGVPVIAYNQGGAAETVVPGITGILYDNNSVTGLKAALSQAKEVYWNPVAIRAQAENFSRGRWEAQFNQFMEAYV